MQNRTPIHSPSSSPVVICEPGRGAIAVDDKVGATLRTSIFSCMFQAAVIHRLAVNLTVPNDSKTLAWFLQTRAISQLPFWLSPIIYLTCVVHKDRGPIPLAKATVPHNRKRQLRESASIAGLCLRRQPGAACT